MTFRRKGHNTPIITNMHHSNTFTYNTILKNYLKNSNPKRALKYFIELKRKGHLGDNYTYPLVLKAVGLVKGLLEGKMVHCEVTKRGYDCNLFVVNGLIGMYCKCKEMDSGRVVFDECSSKKDVVSWNLMLSGYVEVGVMDEAEKLFEGMSVKDVVSWSIMIDGYAKKTNDIVRARSLFDSMPMRERDLICWNTMMDAYAKVGQMVVAHQLFNEMPEKNVISWSIMIDGYVQKGNSSEALNLFRQMLLQGIKPDNVSMVGAIMACAQIGALNQGRWIHMYIKKNQIHMDVVVETSLMDMYIKCGSVGEAYNMFNSMSKRSVISWNVMIAGLGINGFGEEALKCFARMEMEGVLPDDLIFIGVLTACSHSGFVKEGLQIFERMEKDYNVQPKLEHYGCLVDLFCRAGRLDEAVNVVKVMPMKPNSALLGSLLQSCTTYQNIDLAEFAFEKLVEVKSDDLGAYVLMSNMYADAGMWDGVQRIRGLMTDKNMTKEVGKSVTEVEGSIQEFISGDNFHAQSGEIKKTIWSLIRVGSCVK